MNKREHWQQVYENKADDEVSWFQSSADASLDFIKLSDCGKQTAIIDIGGGASCLVDQLLDQQYTKLSVLDISHQALLVAKTRLQERAKQVSWYSTDLLTHQFESSSIGLWHDRAVFHFLTEEQEQIRYIEQLNEALYRGGFAVISTFDIGGPNRCSGIPIKQYSWQTLNKRLGTNFKLLAHRQESHRTPFNTHQAFNYCLFEKIK